MHVGTTRALLDLFKALYEEQDTDWSPESRHRKVPSRAREVKEQLTQYWCPPVSRKELEKWLAPGNQIDIDFMARDRVLYLPPLEKDGTFVPVLSVKCRLDDCVTELRLRVLLVSKDDDDNLRCIGFRLDTPEWQNKRERDPETVGRGMHDFYHAQWMSTLEMRRQLHSSLMWLPCTQPSFPVTADDPVTLVMALILSLYGKKYYGQFMNRHKSPRLKQYRKRVDEWIQWPSD